MSTLASLISMVSAFIVGLVVQHLGGKVGVALLIHSATLKLPKMNKITCKLLPSGGNLEDDISILRDLPLQAKRAALGF